MQSPHVGVDFMMQVSQSMVIESGLLLMWNKLVSRSDNRFGMPKADRPSSQLPPLPALPAYSGR